MQALQPPLLLLTPHSSLLTPLLMLDVRPTAYIVPLAEQVLDDITPVIQVTSTGDEAARVTGLIRIYRKSTDQLLYSSELATTIVPGHSTVNIAALSAWSPPAPADDDYFLLCDTLAASVAEPCDPDEMRAALGAFTFDVKPGPMGPAPAAHAPTHQDGGMDEVNIQGLSGVPAARGLTNGLASLDGTTRVPAVELGTGAPSGLKFLRDDRTWQVPAGGGNVEDLPTAEMDDTLVLAPNGAGGVEFRAEAGGVTDHGALTGLADDDHPQYRLRHEIVIENDHTAPISGATLHPGLSPWMQNSFAGGPHSSVPGTPSHPGISRISSSVSANSGGGWLTEGSAFLIAGSEKSVIIFRPQTLAGTTATLGFLDYPYSLTQTDAIYFHISQVGGIDGTLVGKTRNNAAESATATSYALTANTWYTGIITINAYATRVDFSLYDDAGNLLWTDFLTTNIPTAAGRQTGNGWAAANSSTTAAPLLDVDFTGFKIPDRRPNL